MKKISLLLGLLLFSFTLVAQNNERPHRVLEAEEYFSQRVNRTMERLLGNDKFLITVRVTPQASSREVSRSRLPLYSDREDLVNPWESYEVPLFSLLRMVTQIRIHLVIDQNNRITDLSALRETIFRENELIPGRDEIVISFEAFPTSRKSFDELLNDSNILASLIIFFALLIVAIVLFVISRRKIDVRSDNSSSPSKSTLATPINAPVQYQSVSPRSEGGGSKRPSFVELSSSLKELPQKIDKIALEGTFPRLDDLIALEELLINDPEGFSFLVNLFSPKKRKEIFSLGRSEDWVHAFCDIGMPSNEAVMTVERLLRPSNFTRQHEHELLLIDLWRCEDRLQELMAKQSDLKSCKALLSHLPKDIALPVARSLYPGAWAEILNIQGLDLLRADLTQQLRKEAQTLRPHFDENTLKELVERKDLINYLDTVNPEDEEEIYKVLSIDFDVSKVRPPYFSFLNSM
jgi:hypothetical protein